MKRMRATTGRQCTSIPAVAAACRSVVLALLAGCAAVQQAGAQERRVRDDLDDVFDDIFFVWSRPFHATAHDLEGAAVVGGLVGAALLVDAPVQRWLDEHPRSLPVLLLNPFREHSPLNVLGRTYLLAPVSAALWLTGAALDEDGLRDAGLGCMAANVATTLSRVTFSWIVGRRRPRFTDDPYEFDVPALGGWEQRSFPGGHGANIMTCTSFWTHRFELGAAEPVLFAVAALVGMGRVADGAHWTSDSLFGMSWGFAVGKAVAGESRVRENDRREGLRLQPYLQWSIRF